MIVSDDQVEVIKHHFLKFHSNGIHLNWLILENFYVLFAEFLCLHQVIFLLALFSHIHNVNTFDEVDIGNQFLRVLFELVQKSVHLEHELFGQHSVFGVARWVHLKGSKFFLQAFQHFVNSALLPLDWG